MNTPSVDSVLAQAEALPPQDQLALLARLAAHVHTSYMLAPEVRPPERMPISERLARANYRGGRFRSVEEVDAYIRQERSSWGD